jgi:hypothetical protein
VQVLPAPHSLAVTASTTADAGMACTRRDLEHAAARRVEIARGAFVPGASPAARTPHVREDGLVLVVDAVFRNQCHVEAHAVDLAATGVVIVVQHVNVAEAAARLT